MIGCTFLSIVREISVRGLRNRFEPGKGEEGTDKSFTIAGSELQLLLAGSCQV